MRLTPSPFFNIRHSPFKESGGGSGQEFRHEGVEMTEEMQHLEWVEFNEELKRFVFV